jgi:hypothetical protein
MVPLVSIAIPANTFIENWIFPNIIPELSIEIGYILSTEQIL